ncbi:MAG TPA: RNA methyltransferase [Victivallales bacterium]|nr:RNA methyltransferase [Victivallales bacterium]
MIITSSKNERIKRLVRLRSRKGRDEEKTALIEGYRALSRALETGVEVKEIYFCPSLFLGENEHKILSAGSSRGAELFETTPEVFAKFAYRDRPEGLVATIPTRDHNINEIPLSANATYLVLEGIEKPGNLGSILRSADATGVSGVIVCEKRTDIYNPNVITASTGAIFTVPLAESSRENTYKWLRSNNIRIIATTPHTKKIYSDENLLGAVALLLGSEQCGLDPFWLENADSKVRIPMLGMADSLNVSVSATLMMYEAAKQKNWKTSG